MPSHCKQSKSPNVRTLGEANGPTYYVRIKSIESGERSLPTWWPTTTLQHSSAVIGNTSLDHLPLNLFRTGYL